MKNILYIVLSLGILFTSCSDSFLDQKSPDELTFESYWKDASAAEKVLVSCYAEQMYKSWHWGEEYFIPLNYKGDDITMLPGSSDWGYLKRMGSFEYTSGNSTLYSMWSKNYSCIRYANDLIARIPTIPADKISDDKRAQLMSEAYFMRGFAHMMLNINFTTIIVRDEAISTSNLIKKDSSKEDAWKLIVGDFQKAAEHLPASWDDNNVGRATKGAAYGFLGKAYLYQKQYTEAINAFKEVMKLGYDLTDDYEGMFDGTNENSKESLFEIQYTTQEAGGMWGSASQASFMAIGKVSGWHMLRPSQYLIDEFEKEKTTAGEPDKRLVASICYNDAAGKSEFLGQPWSSYYGVGETPEAMFKKFNDGIAPAKSGKSGINVPVLRYADVLLMYAEALNESNGLSSDILSALNKVRNRAGLKDFTLTDTGLIRAEIRHQRLLEFPCEGIRFQDMVRYGDVKQQLLDHGHIYANNYMPKCDYYPIPSTEVAQNSVLEPTPGY